ncbi:LacI family DNA-binding transcriptional regulator [Nocardia sp. BMG51109]|uniref:LacI family DNA-binding transcriptional regulator n=1 Tax=Nocardia sp. BMG51109 TaxID=1056816 RepID=UPI0004664BC7|nr:LacI family DNA-binding transcriptional regulator [Nocardia sp. BMG51109]
MTVTLLDVARAAGVSRSTASRALSGSTLISPETRTAVENAARRLQYRPNRAASTLRSRRSNLLGLVMNNLVNASFHTVAEVVHRRAAQAGLQVILCITDADGEREADVLAMLAEHGVDAAIIIGTGSNPEATNALMGQNCAVVNLIRSVHDCEAPTVLADDYNGAHDATRHLLRLGHRQIGYVGGHPTATSGRERFAGYRRALEDAGLEVDPALVRKGPFTTEFGEEATESLLDGSPRITALYAANHEAVFGVLPTLVRAGVTLPGDLSLVCHEDMPWLGLWRPAITVIDNGAQQLADMAMDLVLQQMNSRDRGESALGRTYRVGARLIERDSCARYDATHNQNSNSPDSG